MLQCLLAYAVRKLLKAVATQRRSLVCQEVTILKEDDRVWFTVVKLQNR